MITRGTKTRTQRQISSSNTYQMDQALNKPYSHINPINTALHKPLTRQSIHQRNQNSFDLHTQQSLKLLHYNNQNIKLSTPLQTECYSYTLQNSGVHRKDNSNKNRDFVNKVQNINKIHQQISSMLSYVKNGQSKSASKGPKYLAHEKTTSVDKALQNSIKQKLNCILSNERYPLKQNIQSSYQPMINIQNILPSKLLQRQLNSSFTIPNQQLTQTQYTIKDNDQSIPLSYKYDKRNIDQYINQKSKRTAPISQSKQPSMQVSKTTSKPWINEQRQAKIISKSHNFTDFERNILYPYRQPELPTQKTKQSEDHRRKRSQINNQFPKKLQKRTYSYSFESQQLQFLSKKPSQKNLKLQSEVVKTSQYLKLKQKIEQEGYINKKIEQKYKISSNYLQQQNSHMPFESNFSKPKKYSELSEKQHTTSHNFQQNPRLKLTKIIDNISEQNNQIYQSQQKQFQLKVYPCTLQPTKQINTQQDLYQIIAQQLSKQVKLDQKLRDAREIFNNSALADKWKLLKQLLHKRGHSYSEQQLEKQLTISPRQSNPFPVQLKSTSNDTQNLVQAFLNAEQFWSMKISKFISKSVLQKWLFTPHDLDLDQRGYLIVEDLVCFINLHSSNYFRNRDVICLFKRMMDMGNNYNGIEYETFINIIAIE